MFKKNRFPDEADILEKLERVQDIPNTTRELTEAILELRNTPFTELNRQQKEFVTDTLPDVFKDIVGLNKPSKKINMEINIFTEAYLKLTSEYNLNIDMIHVIGKIFDKQMREFKLRMIGEVTAGTKEKFLNFSPEFEYLLPAEKRPHCNQTVKEIINQLFTAGIVAKMFENISNQTTKPEIFAEFLTIYSGIESSLVDEAISIMLPIIFEEIMRLLDVQQTDFSGLCSFLAKHFRASSFYASRIIETLCKMSEVGNFSKRNEVVGEIIEIASYPVNQPLVAENAEIIKKTFIDAININQNQIILNQIYNFLPKFSEICSFSVEDIESTIEKSQGSCPTSMIMDIIPNLQDAHLDKFTTFLITNKYFYPDLFSSLMNRIRGPSCRKLLSYMLENKEMLQKVGLEGFKMTPNIKTYIAEIEPNTPEIIESLSLFYIKSPRIEQFHDFIMATINMIPQNPSLINVLMNFTETMTKFDSEGTICDVFNFFFNKFMEEGSDSWAVSLLPIITAWIGEVNRVPSHFFFEKFKQLNYENCPNVIPSLFNIVVAKSDDQTGVIDLLFNIISNDVPIRHVHWAISEIFSLIKDNAEQVANACSMILAKPSESHFRMIFEAAKFEADYFRLEDTNFGVKQKVVIKENNAEFYVSFTPIHSSRRLYAAVANHSDIPIDELLLWNADPLNEFVIPFGCPLTSLHLSSTETLFVSIEKTKDKILHQAKYEPHFLTCLSSPEKSEILANLLSQSHNIQLFRVAELIDPSNIPVINDVLINLLHGEISDISDFVNEYLPLFPAALNALVESGKATPSDIESSATFIAEHTFDSVSTAICCDALIKSPIKIKVSREVAELIILKAEDSRIREMAINIIGEVDDNLLIHLIELSTKLEYRSHSNQLYRFIKTYELSHTIFESFYDDLVQFEMSSVWDIDETFIGLLDYIEVNEKTIKTTFNRLFTQPTCVCFMTPFLQTHESRTAAYNFLKDPKALPHISAFLQKLKSTPNYLVTFSDDFTPKGRLGLLNFSTTCYINAVLQNMIAMPNVLAPILDLPANGLTPFVMELRKLLALIRYGRGTPLNITHFTETVPEFEPNLQQDAHEFFDLVINKLTKEIPDPEVINQQLCGKIMNEICNSKTGEVLTSNEESFYYLTLAIKGLKNIVQTFEKFFEDSEISGGYRIDSGEYVQAVRRNRVVTWPNYLVLQLQRWDYAYLSRERSKLTQELQFPVEITPPSCADKYQLTGVIVHEGEADSGHYMAIVRNETGNDWYFCNDQDIVNFDPANLGPWCFGGEPKPGDSVWTGYLLFYKKIGMQEVFMPEVNPDLQLIVDEYNDSYWPAQCLYSFQYIKYVEELIMAKEQTETTLDIIYRTLMRVILINEESLQRWTDLLTKNILTNVKNCQIFFNYVKLLFGPNLPAAISITDAVVDNFRILVQTAMSVMSDTTEHLQMLLQGIDYGSHKRAMVFALDIIAYCCDNLAVDWSREESALFLMAVLLTMEIQKEVQRSTGTKHFQAFDSLAKVMCDAVKSTGATEAMATFLDVNTLNRIVDNLKMSNNFMTFLALLANTRPDLLEHLIDASPRVQTIVNSAIPIQIGGTNEIAMTIDLSFYFSHGSDFIFSVHPSIRNRTYETFKLLIGSPEPHIDHYFHTRPYDPSIPVPKVTAESSFTHYIISLSDDFLQVIQQDAMRGCEYVCLLQSVVGIAPMSTKPLFNKLIGPIIADKSGDLLELFMPVIHHLVAFDPDILITINEEEREVFRNMAQPTIMDVELVLMAPNVFAGSWLLSECVDFVLTQLTQTEACDRLISLLKEIGCQVRCPKEAKDKWVLWPALQLWEIGCCDKNDLALFIVSALKKAQPAALCKRMKIVQKAIETVKEFKPELIDESVINL
ncbi:Clan CA, family C19, ubiquitin hydrolase-like cysteine peptidase [Trichomonas vaginalis G3]|uniref:Clan CA, family C19, ubiquitin hydrolase-like cysteine peptidase n=1 Tax=Trichomonas vaginalis (strain ATCC PRA-98 / G3) TaxID=412133 RepID=A2F8U2_TRIV3|nr:ubiquitinyl hydrolase protein [Trichomonas vaginalis G3]EAX98678.1 Clan CA, family C19, ubiquitin hydrolase-like cysteine peptidase [Trichomonas vaginalis G3]KAI5545809.1 ubiquitinyl hydrolase protein [Trichomonas vaginalis G3]|eukprot:XP_001311608.1 Clan CA, family C19, ubiquitin hydrolase-like cysteine peptidase [Trichomonas vaginalis G3]